MSAAAQGSGDADHPSTQLQNLIYYPHKGEFLLTPQANVSLEDSAQTINNNGVETNSSSTYCEELILGLTYGVMNRFRVGISEIVDAHKDTTSSTEKLFQTTPSLRPRLAVPMIHRSQLLTDISKHPVMARDCTLTSMFPSRRVSDQKWRPHRPGKPATRMAELGPPAPPLSALLVVSSPRIWPCSQHK